jgi:hypothetical protein
MLILLWGWQLRSDHRHPQNSQRAPTLVVDDTRTLWLFPGIILDYFSPADRSARYARIDIQLEIITVSQEDFACVVRDYYTYSPGYFFIFCARNRGDNWSKLYRYH